MAAVPARCAAVLLALWARANPRDESPEVWPSRATVALDTGLDERTVRRALSELEQCGAIERLSGTRIRLHRRARVSAPDTGARAPMTAPDTGAPGHGCPPRPILSGTRTRVPSPPDTGAPQTLNEHSWNTKEERALATRISDQEKPRAVRPRGADDEAQPWRAVLTEARMLTPPGARPVGPGGQRPPDGIVDVIDRLGVRGTVEVLTQYAAYCRRHPEQSKWWSWGMFSPKRWDVVERMAAEMTPQATHETEAQRIIREIRGRKKC